MTDVFGRIQYEYIEITKPSGNKYIEKRPIINPDWNPSDKYVPRSERPEWVKVGLIGQIVVNDDGTCKPGGYCKASQNGIATSSDDGFYVMKRLDESHVLILFR